MKKPSRNIVAILVLLVFALGTFVYAASMLGTVRTGTITVYGLNAGASVSTDGTTWSALGADLDIALGTNVYVRLQTTDVGISSPISITWVIYLEGLEVTTLTDYTTATLDGTSGQLIYCSPDGTTTSLLNWLTYMTDYGTYEIEAIVNIP